MTTMRQREMLAAAVGGVGSAADVVKARVLLLLSLGLRYQSDRRHEQPIGSIAGR